MEPIQDAAVNTAFGTFMGYFGSSGLNAVIKWSAIPAHSLLPSAINPVQGGCIMSLCLVVDKITSKAIHTLLNTFSENVNAHANWQVLLTRWAINVVSTAYLYSLAAPRIATYLGYTCAAISISQTTYLVAASLVAVYATGWFFERSKDSMSSISDHISPYYAGVLGYLGSHVVNAAIGSTAINPIYGAAAFVTTTVISRLTNKFLNNVPKEDLIKNPLARFTLAAIATSLAAKLAASYAVIPAVSLAPMGYLYVAGIASYVAIEQLKKVMGSPLQNLTAGTYAAAVGYLASETINMAVKWIQPTHLFAPSLINPIQGAAAFALFTAINKITEYYTSKAPGELGGEEAQKELSKNPAVRLARYTFSIIATSYASTFATPYIAPYFAEAATTISIPTMACLATASIITAVIVKQLIHYYELPNDKYAYPIEARLVH